MGDSRHTGDGAAAATAVRDREPWKVHANRPLPALLDHVKEMAVGQLHARLAEEGFPEIRPGHGCVFRFVEPDGSRLTDLADRAGLTKQAVGEVVTDLERLGHVERRSCPDDGRAKIIHLTGSGREAVAAAERIFADIEARWAAEVGERRMADLRATLNALVELDRSERPDQ
ncbi:MAG TPA: MarR family transcriptional regulator [Thermoleophilaceae bacterium]|jgi:DNA-binding MarR family transcriptional regulator